MLADFDPGKTPDIRSEVSPYKGLAPFSRADTSEFFGREDEANELQKRLEGNNPVVVLLGPPGSGKSSLIKAGLLPRLEDRGHKVVLVAAPGREPLAAILRAIKPAAEIETIRSEERNITKTPKKLNDVVSEVYAKAILILDQFDEALARADIHPSLDIVGQALASLSGTHKLLISIRESQRLQFGKITGIGQAVQSATSCFSLPPPAVHELRSMIEGPAERVGLRFADGVVEDLVRSVAGNPDATPLLQFTLNKLWDNREHNEITQSVYREVGSPRNALTSTADAVLQQFSASEREVARRIFLKLVVPAGEKDFVRNRVGRDMLSHGENADVVYRILDAFEHEKLLRKLPVTDIGGEDRFEVGYETLITYWPTLANWLADARQGRATEAKLLATARLWLDSGRSNGYLITGDALEKLKDYQSESPDVKQLLDASLKAKADYNRKRRSRWGLASICAVVAVLALSGLAFELASVAQRRALEDQLERTNERLQALQKIVDQGKPVDLSTSLTSRDKSDSELQTAFPEQVPLQPPQGALALPYPELPHLFRYLRQHLHRFNPNSIREPVTVLVSCG